MEKETMSEREIRLAAEMGREVDASKQNKVLEEAKKRTRMRVQELKEQEAEEQRLREAELANSSDQIVGKRRRQLENNNSGVFEDLANAAEMVQDNRPLKPIVKFRPTEVNNRFKKIKVDKLPSGFLSYPEGAEIYITPYTGDDVDELSNNQLTLKYILTKALEGIYTNFDKKKITFYDLVYLSFYRRILSVNENKIKVMSQCPYCGKFSTHDIEIDKQLDFEEIKIPTLPVNIDFSFGRLSFTFLTYEDYMKLETEMRSEELAYQCVTECEIDTNSGLTREGELQKLFGNLVGEDQALITKLREILYHGVKPINTLCQNPDCGKSYDTFLDEMNAILVPFFPSTKDYRAKVSFG